MSHDSRLTDHGTSLSEQESCNTGASFLSSAALGAQCARKPPLSLFGEPLTSLPASYPYHVAGARCGAALHGAQAHELDGQCASKAGCRSLPP
jgi:hypothetical protein